MRILEAIRKAAESVMNYFRRRDRREVSREADEAVAKDRKITLGVILTLTDDPEITGYAKRQQAALADLSVEYETITRTKNQDTGGTGENK